VVPQAHRLRRRRPAPGGCTRRPVGGRPPSVTRERPVEPDPYVRDECLTIIAVELPNVVVAGTNGAHHRARCVLLDESKWAAPLQPGDVLIVRRMNSGLAAVERVTAGRPDGCWYMLLEFRLIPPPAIRGFACPAEDATAPQRWPPGLDTATSTAVGVTISRSGRLHSPLR
jgi:hypothetical protein